MKGLTIHRDGREVLDLKTVPGRMEYARRTAEMAERQNNFCAICMEWMAEPTFDHQDGRGHGGGHRDDRIEIAGRWYNAAICARDNSLKGSRRFHWQGAYYLPAVYATLADAQRDGYKTDRCDDGDAPWLPGVVV
jgi:hypothetical protein